MRPKKIVLNGFGRFGLSNIQRFTYTPQALEQVILGSNGSGKSSLLAVIMNLVPNGRDFAKTKGGGMEYHFEHEGHQFELISTYNVRAGKHQFIMDGVDLNDGGTQATQKELVAKHTGLTQDLVDLATGKIRFSRMNPMQRRDWMMRISGTDFTYALKLHEHFKDKTTELKGAISYLLENTHKMVGEIESLEEDYKTKDDEISQLKQIVEESSRLMAGRGRQATSEAILARMAEVYKCIRQRSDTILAETIRRSARMNNKTADMLENELIELRDRMSQTRGECNEHERALEGIQSLIKHVGRDVLGNPSGLELQIKTAEEEIAHLLSLGATYECNGESPERLLAIAESIQEGLSELCVTIPSNQAGQYTRSGHQAATERYKQLSQQVIEHNNIISKMEAQLDHAEHTPDTNCPKCQFSFKPGWDPALLQQTKDKLAGMRGSVESMRGEMAELEVVINEFNEYSRKLSELARIREGSKLLKGFWDGISEEQLVRTWPAQIPTRLSTAIVSLTNMVRVQRLSRDLADLKSRLELINNSGDPKFLLERADMLEAKLFEKSRLVRSMVSEVGEISEEIYHIEKLNRLTAEMEESLAEFQMLQDKVSTSLEEDCLDQLKDRCLSRLGVLHQQTQRYRDLVSRYKNNREQIEEAEAKFAGNKLLAEALSPTKGIVAETIKGFIHHFLSLLNEHISMVWTYEMVVGAVLEEGAVLNCKFPISVGGEDAGADDVEDGSTGQVSMIDFAFKLVVFELLGMNDYPLLADEFGKDFDDEHRERLVTYIKSLMEQNRFSQLFMVSHYASVYSAFNNAEFVVLDDRNITRPGIYNEQVEIE